METKLEIFEEVMNSIYSMVRLLSNYYSNTRQYGTNHKLSVSEVHLINEIGKSNNITAKAITSITGKTKGAISQMLEKLELKGLIHKETDPKDNRKKLLLLTEEGKVVYNTHKEIDEYEYQRILEKLKDYTTDDLQLLIKFNNDLINSIDSLNYRKK